MEFNINNLIKWFQLKYPSIVSKMKQSNHHFTENDLKQIEGYCDRVISINPYHQESDVFTHNMMVMLEAKKLEDKCDRNEFIHVVVAALLHDIGKPLARKVNLEKQRVHFWGHEPMSAFLAVPILSEIERDFNVSLNKRLILEAIAMHTDVYNIPREKLEDRLVNNKPLAYLLSWLSECDYAGRFFDMGDRDMEMIEPDIDPTKEIGKDEKQVICLVGLPCSGKSTLVESMMLEGQEMLSRDNIVMEVAAEKGISSYNDAFKALDQKEVDKRFQKRKRELSKSDKTVWVDMTNMSRKSRRKNLRDFKDHKKSALVVMADLEVINLRNGLRPGKTIPQNVYERMITGFQPPLYDEFDEIHWVFND